MDLWANLRTKTYISIIGSTFRAWGEEKSDYSVRPARNSPDKHFLEEVEQLVTMMPIKADKVLWGSILSAARAQGNVGLSQSQWECHSSVMGIKFADVANFL